jgi:hypothetical protein
MINHDFLINKTLVLHDYAAYTDVSLLKFKKSTFSLIIDQFRDLKEDLEDIGREKQIHEQNNNFILESLSNEKVRKLIARNYNLVVQ